MIGKKLKMLERKIEEKDTGNDSGRRGGTRNEELNLQPLGWL